MNPWQRWLLLGLSAVVTATGIALFWMKEWLVPADPFSLVSHPLEPLSQQLHVLAAPALVFVVGTAFEGHIARKLRAGSRPNRRSGIVALAAFGVMTASGYLLQVATAQSVIRVALYVHLGSGLGFAAAYALHLGISLRHTRACRRRERQRADDCEAVVA